MEKAAEAIQKRVQDLRPEVLSFLRSLVEVNSYSRNYEGINRVGEVVAGVMPADLGHRIHLDRNGVNHHIFENTAASGGPVVLIGHVDTVFPPRTRSRKFEAVDGRVYGPGTADMKGGITVMVYALKVLEEMGLLPAIPLRVLVNGDEEIGSPHSSSTVEELGRGASCALVFECGGLNGEVVHCRRGIRRFRLTVRGKARHAGVKSGAKDSAVVELSRMVLALEALNEEDTGVSLNVGKISGGTATNIVPDLAKASFEFRFWDENTEERVLDSIRDITGHVQCEGCSAKLVCHHSRPAGRPAQGTDRLFSVLASAAEELGMKVAKEKRGGTSDANFLMAQGIPTLDGMGPIGDLDHSPDEYIIEESLYERIALTALLLTKVVG
ncbi:MAG: M20 family metallopeptidase [bacterium]|nr:MAG: M20 family metallopeptidase [bacterium]